MQLIQQNCQPSLKAYYNLLGGFSHTVFTIKHFFFAGKMDVFEKLGSSVHFRSQQEKSRALLYLGAPSQALPCTGYVWDPRRVLN